MIYSSYEIFGFALCSYVCKTSVRFSWQKGNGGTFSCWYLLDIVYGDHFGVLVCKSKEKM